MSFTWTDVVDGGVADPDIENAMGRAVANHEAILGGTFPLSVTSTGDGSHNGGAYTFVPSGLAPSPLSITFTAVKPIHTIEVSAKVINSGAGGPFNGLLSFQVTGAMTYGPNDTDAANQQQTNNNIGGTVSRRTPVAGFVPGLQYTVTATFRVTGSTFLWNAIRLIVE